MAPNTKDITWNGQPATIRLATVGDQLNIQLKSRKYLDGLVTLQADGNPVNQDLTTVAEWVALMDTVAVTPNNLWSTLRDSFDRDWIRKLKEFADQYQAFEDEALGAVKNVSAGTDGPPSVSNSAPTTAASPPSSAG